MIYFLVNIAYAIPGFKTVERVVVAAPEGCPLPDASAALVARLPALDAPPSITRQSDTFTVQVESMLLLATPPAGEPALVLEWTPPAASAELEEDGVDAAPTPAPAEPAPALPVEPTSGSSAVADSIAAQIDGSAGAHAERPDPS